MPCRHKSPSSPSGDADVSEKPVFGSTIRNVTMTPPPWPAPPADRKHSRSSAVFGVVAVFLAAAALVVAMVALTRTDATPTYSEAQRSEAQARLCDRYKLAAQAVHLETTGPDGDVALARIANTNGALILATAASDPALEVKFRDAAQALATSYQTVTAMGTMGKSDPQFVAAIDDSNAKYQVMRDLCGD